MSVGMPVYLYLIQYGARCAAVFGPDVYHVGSSLKRKRGWRDVDVRAMLSDDDWIAWGFGTAPDECPHGAQWESVVMAFSALGQHMTGLPIDFQVQPTTWANKQFQTEAGCVRSWIGGRGIP